MLHPENRTVHISHSYRMHKLAHAKHGKGMGLYAHLAERITKLLIREREVNMVSKNQSDQKHYLIDSLIRNETTNQEYILHLLEEFKIPLTTPKRILLIQIPSRYNPTNISMLEQIILPFFKELKLSLFTFRSSYLRQHFLMPLLLFFFKAVKGSVTYAHIFVRNNMRR